MKPEDKLYVQLASEGKSNREIGRLLGVDESTVRRGLDRAGFHRQYIPTALEERFLIQLDEPLRVQGDVMVTADWHIPLYDPEYVNECIEVARQEKLKTLVIGGDFWNFDALSQYYPKQDEANLRREHSEGLAVMRVLLQTFDRIIYIWGNHDARLHKALGHALAFSDSMRMVFGRLGEEALDKIEFSNLDHLWVDSGGEKWYVCHPASYARRPLSTAIRLASKLGSHVITAHSHHSAVGYAENGVHVVAEAGGLFDRRKTAYLQRTTTYPTWQQGFAYIKEGKLRMFSPGWSTV